MGSTCPPFILFGSGIRAPRLTRATGVGYPSQISLPAASARGSCARELATAHASARRPLGHSISTQRAIPANLKLGSQTNPKAYRTFPTFPTAKHFKFAASQSPLASPKTFTLVLIMRRLAAVWQTPVIYFFCATLMILPVDIPVDQEVPCNYPAHSGWQRTCRH